MTADGQTRLVMTSQLVCSVELCLDQVAAFLSTLRLGQVQSLKRLRPLGEMSTIMTKYQLINRFHSSNSLTDDPRRMG